MVDSTTLTMVDSATIHEIAISDHAPITIEIKDTTRNTSRITWRFPTFLEKQKAFQKYLHTEWHIYKEFNWSADIDPSLYWEAGKAFLQDRIIAYTKYYKK